MKPILRVITLILVSLPLWCAPLLSGQQPAAGAQLKVTLDSSYMLMGRVTPLHIDLKVPAGARGTLLVPVDTMATDVEVAAASRPDTTRLPDGRLNIRQTLTLQSFDSGMYLLRPVMYVAGSDTLLSNRVSLRVIPCDVDTLTDIHDYAPVAEMEPGAWDWVPDWLAEYYGLWICAIIVVIALVLLYMLWWRKRPKGQPIVLRPRQKPVPPHILALRELQQLKAEGLCEQGMEKEFYTRLTDILRRYIDSRFHINAREMTSSQILKALRSNPEASLPERYMRQILEIADYVKFARMRPFSEDNARAMADAEQFVDDTKPAPAADASAAPEPKIDKP